MRIFLHFCLLCSLFTLFCLGLHAQNSPSALAVAFWARDGKLLLDGQPVRKIGVWQGLSAGSHRLEAWAPDRVPLDTTFVIAPGDSMKMHLRLPMRPEYLEMRSAQKAKSKEKAFGYLGAVAGGTLTAFWLINDGRHTKQMQPVLAERDSLFIQFSNLVLPASLTDMREELAGLEEEYLAIRRKRIVGHVLFGAGVGATAFFAATRFIRAKKTKIPDYQSSPLPDRFQVSWYPNLSGGQVFSLSYNF